MSVCTSEDVTSETIHVSPSGVVVGPVRETLRSGPTGPTTRYRRYTRLLSSTLTACWCTRCHHVRPYRPKLGALPCSITREATCTITLAYPAPRSLYVVTCSICPEYRAERYYCSEAWAETVRHGYQPRHEGSVTAVVHSSTGVKA